MRTINANELREMSTRGEHFTLINVLPEKDFPATRIPGAHNIPLETLNFATRVEQRTGEKDKEVVVYCANEDCQASTKAAQQLEAVGFTNVMDFKGGARAWNEAEHPKAAVL